MSIPDKEALDKFVKYHRTNPHIYDEFCRITLDLIHNKGITRCSHWLILNQIRWNSMIRTKSDDFKISNNHFTYYARMFICNHPQHSDFFELKKLK